MNLQQFPYSSDNFSYVIFGKHSALAIDGGAVESILDFVQKKIATYFQLLKDYNFPSFKNYFFSFLVSSIFKLKSLLVNIY